MTPTLIADLICSLIEANLNFKTLLATSTYSYIKSVYLSGGFYCDGKSLRLYNVTMKAIFFFDKLFLQGGQHQPEGCSSAVP